MRPINPQLSFSRPVLVRLLALTAYMYVAIAMGPLVPAARAGAIANAYGGGSDIDVPKNIFLPPKTGQYEAEAEHSDSGNNGSWSASASVAGTFAILTDTRDNVELK